MDASTVADLEILCDEQFPHPIFHALKAEGYAIDHMNELAPGTPDDEILAVCRLEEVVLLTNDQGFLTRSEEHSGIFFLDDQETEPQEAVTAITNIDATVGLEEMADRVEHIPDGWLW